MTLKSLDDLFQDAAGVEPAHPRVRRWRELKAAGYDLELEVYRRWDGLTFTPARLFVTARKGADPGDLEDVLWEEELNQGLVELGVRAKDAANEVERYALAFRSAFDVVARRHGQDWLRYVVVEFLNDSALSSTPELRATLEQVKSLRPARGHARDGAAQAIEAAVRTKAHELTTKLGYDQTAAVEILGKALARYVEEIFHLKARRAWFGA